jgi:TonB family protein
MPRRKRFVMPSGAMILLALAVVVVAGVVFRQSQTNVPQAATSVTEAKAPAPTTPSPAPPSAPAPETVTKPAAAEPKTPVAETKPAPTEKTPFVEGVLNPDQPLPRVTDKARNTITGKVKVTIKADADANGNVTKAEIESSSSKFFAASAVEAVRKWKFQPLENRQGNQQWRVRFEFLRSGTKAMPERVSP